MSEDWIGEPPTEEWRRRQALAPSEPPPLGGPLPILIGAAVAVILVGGAILLAGSLGDRVANALDDPSQTIAPGQEVVIVVEAGATASAIGDQLEEAGVVVSASDFAARVTQRQLAPALRAGTFNFLTGMELDAVIDILASGVATEFRLTVVEGLTVAETLASIAASTQVTVEELETALLDGSVTSAFAAEQPSDLAGWEGLLFPDTYEYLVGSSAAQILQRMSDTMASRVASVDWSRLDELGLDQYEAIIVASLIEEEVRLEEERPIVASVIYNRLANDWLLQIDATVQYALPERKPTLSFVDLEVDSPYNTYLNPGLPPTPISGVRLTSLQAAADPASTPFFYYVLTNVDGTHSFAETEAEFELLKEQARRDGVLPPS
jgi:UPF0755 protein